MEDAVALITETAEHPTLDELERRARKLEATAPTDMTTPEFREWVQALRQMRSYINDRKEKDSEQDEA